MIIFPSYVKGTFKHYSLLIAYIEQFDIVECSYHLSAFYILDEIEIEIRDS